jgi:hypothetical protein
MAEAAMQQDDRRAVAVGRMPDAGAVMVQPAFNVRCRQKAGAVRFEPGEVVVLDFAFIVLPSVSGRRASDSNVRTGETSQTAAGRRARVSRARAGRKTGFVRENRCPERPA